MLKIALPLLAIGLLGAVIFWSGREKDGIGLTFSEENLNDLSTGLKITEPQLSGASLAGDIYDFRAESVVPTDAELTGANITALSGRISYRSGQIVTLMADRATVDFREQTVALDMGIVITTSNGYTASADLVLVDIVNATLFATGPVRADGPIGQIEAADLRISPPPESDDGKDTDALIRFDGGVTLRYTPGQENRP